MRRLSMEDGLVQVIEALYKSSASAVWLENQMADNLHTTLLPELLNFFLDIIVSEIFNDHHTSISIGKVGLKHAL